MNDEWKNFEPRRNAPRQEADKTPELPEVLKTPLKKRTAPEMREAASARLDLAIDAVEAILRDSEARHSDKLAAAVFIRDTSHGKPTERVEHTVDLMSLILGANKKEQALIGGTIGGTLPTVVIDNNDKSNG